MTQSTFTTVSCSITFWMFLFCLSLPYLQSTFRIRLRKRFLRLYCCLFSQMLSLLFTSPLLSQDCLTDQVPELLLFWFTATLLLFLSFMYLITLVFFYIFSLYSNITFPHNSKHLLLFNFYYTGYIVCESNHLFCPRTLFLHHDFHLLDLFPLPYVDWSNKE